MAACAAPREAPAPHPERSRWSAAGVPTDTAASKTLTAEGTMGRLGEGGANPSNYVLDNGLGTATVAE